MRYIVKVQFAHKTRYLCTDGTAYTVEEGTRGRRDKKLRVYTTERGAERAAAALGGAVIPYVYDAYEGKLAGMASQPERPGGWRPPPDHLI